MLPCSPNNTCVIFSHVAVSFVVFLHSVSELLMGEVDSSTLLSLLPTEKSRVSSSQTDRNYTESLYIKSPPRHIPLKEEKETPSVMTSIGLCLSVMNHLCPL